MKRKKRDSLGSVFEFVDSSSTHIPMNADATVQVWESIRATLTLELANLESELQRRIFEETDDAQRSELMKKRRAIRKEFDYMRTALWELDLMVRGTTGIELRIALQGFIAGMFAGRLGLRLFEDDIQVGQTKKQMTSKMREGKPVYEPTREKLLADLKALNKRHPRLSMVDLCKLLSESHGVSAETIRKRSQKLKILARHVRPLTR